MFERPGTDDQACGRVQGSSLTSRLSKTIFYFLHSAPLRLSAYLLSPLQEVGAWYTGAERSGFRRGGVSPMQPSAVMFPRACLLSALALAYHLAPEAFADAQDTTGEGSAGTSPGAQQGGSEVPLPPAGRFSPEEAYVRL